MDLFVQEILRFESCVVLDGSQTCIATQRINSLFESCVVLDGSQTNTTITATTGMFESCVVLDGSQTLQVNSPIYS